MGRFVENYVISTLLAFDSLYVNRGYVLYCIVYNEMNKRIIKKKQKTLQIKLTLIKARLHEATR